MRNKLLAIINVLIIFGILTFVVLYSRSEQKKIYDNRIASFENLTIALESITENYLQGEQGICDVWASYINKNNMTLDEATEFVKSSHVLTNTAAHLIYADTLSGLSTRPNIMNPYSYDVSYSNVDIFGNREWIADVGKAINVSRAYTNPMNGKQSLAFINKITVDDGGSPRDALLLRIVLVSELEDKWTFPQQEFKDAELSIINANGDYIIRGSSFKSNNFFEFYKSYNAISNTELQTLKEEVTITTGNLFMKDSRGDTCVIAHTPIATANGWVMLNYIQNSKLSTSTGNWLLIGVVSVALLLLLLANGIYMRLVNKRLHQMAIAAESANKAKTDFLSTMSHDIRTPMNAIIGLTAISEKKIDDKKIVSENLRKISLASNHLLTLINDVLDLSKVESGKLSLNPLNFSVVEMVETLVNISQPMIKEKDINFNVRVDNVNTEYLYADQIRLNQVFINILSNAIKYTQPGGTVSIALKQEDSDKEGFIRQTYIVSDTGMGMSEEFMAVMYQPFSRQTDSRVNKIQGTGLGLAITKKMVDLMGGTIECQSELGKGTTFTVTIDLKIADKQNDEMMLKPIDVLLIDDDEDLLATAADTLASLGATAEKANSGAKGVELVSSHKDSKMYDVIIVDWKMKAMDGIETARKIREIIGDKTPILLTSAYDWNDAEEAIKDSSINGFISKPLFKSTLYAKISELLDMKVAQVEVEDDYSDIEGMVALIAEDNDINWEIIHTLLEMHKVGSVRANNGKVCLEKLMEAKPGEYDLIFMDIQMPEMNGLDATRAIRKLEDKEKANIPIIAMTADAFSENVAECINAGMNGHIAKPIDIKFVIKEIRKIKENKK
ncbi:MAG: response regulator [Bacilli bacterium]|nr:response regulator [Bacilli bacterium]